MLWTATIYLVQALGEHSYFHSNAWIRWKANFEGEKQRTLSPWKARCFPDLVNKSYDLSMKREGKYD